ncbi:MAG: mechanosensitive ion channel [Verrucomicrobia bacterium]|nr:mechanosensitive ion channel [Verrucomicrobiota bacterium]
MALLVAVLAPGFGARTAPAQTHTSASAVAGTSTELTSLLQARIAEAQTDLNLAQAALRVSTNLPAGATAAEAIDYRSALQRLVRTYQLHLDDLAELDALRQRQVDLDHSVRAWTGFAEPPPYSILFVDDLRDSVQSLDSKIKAAETTRAVVEKFIAEAQTLMKETDEKLRRLSEQLEEVKDSALAARLVWQRELEQVHSRVAAATMASFETRRRKANEELSENRQRRAFAQRKLALAAPHVSFSQADLDKVMGSLETEGPRLETEAQAADADLDTRRKALAEAREKLRLTFQETAQPTTNAAALHRLQELVDVRSTQAQTSADRLGVVRQLLDGLSTERQMWQTRFAYFGSRNLAELQNAYRRLEWLSGLVAAAKPYFKQQIELAANEITEQQNRLQNQAEAPADLMLTRERLESFQQRAELYRRALQGLEKRERLVLRWRESLDWDRQALPFTGRVRDLFAGASGFAAKFWNFELFVAEDTITVEGQPITGRRSVTIGKVLAAILILVVGYWVSSLVARGLERLAVRRLKVEQNQANLIRRWVRVGLVMGLVMFSLISVKIPLTIFAFAGGALAIGLGFGTQNLLKNFISGIIILFERPFRVGDVLDVGGQRGTVTSIGIRSSILQLWDNTETLIPNSALLENNLTNWTYSNRTVRFTVTIGVAYGSDTRRVAQLLGEVAERHGLVQKEPKPQVLFTDFGDSALTFELRYWVDVLKHNAAQVASDLRHMITGAFAENSIPIAFPQRDVHLDSAKPLQVQVLSASEVKGVGKLPSTPPPSDPLTS